MTDERRTEFDPAGDDDLVRRFVSGQDPEQAFGELFRRYGALTYAFFKRRIGAEALAAEQNQELYVSVLENLHRFRGECPFRSWLFNLAHNRLSQLRRRLHVHVDECSDEPPAGLWDTLVGPATDHPDLHADRAESRRLLRLCMAHLTDVERAVVFGQYYHEVTLKDLGRRIGLTNPSGARASLIAAQRKLRQCMQRSGVHGAGDRRPRRNA